MKVLIIGLGSIAQKHIAALRSIDPQVELFALRYNPNASEVEGICNIYNWEDAYTYNFDFAIISNPTSEHTQTIDKLLKFNNLPLFIEKPLHSGYVNPAWVKKINNSRITYCACNLRFLECLSYFKKNILPTIRINEVNVYCGSYLPSWRPNVDYRQVYSAIPELGGGVHIDLIHEIDYVYWMLGMPQNISKRFSNHSSLGIAAFDYANYLFEYHQFSANIILNYYRKDSKRTIEFVCENATYLVNLEENAIYKYGERIFESNKKIIDTYLPQMEYFVDCINNKQDSFNTIEDAATVLNICLQ